MFLVFFAGSSGRLFVFLELSYEAQISFWRFASWVIPALVAVGAFRACRALQRFDEVERIRKAAEDTPDPVSARR